MNSLNQIECFLHVCLQLLSPTDFHLVAGVGGGRGERGGRGRRSHSVVVENITETIASERKPSGSDGGDAGEGAKGN